MGKRGQVAMEFLMTYGWAILIILIAVGALWMLGVFSPNVSTNCSIDAPFSCQDAFIGADYVSLKLGVGAGVATAKINQILVNGEPCTLPEDYNFEGGDLKNIICFGVGLEESEKTTVEIHANYKKSGGFTKPVEGSISGQAKDQKATSCKGLPFTKSSDYYIDPDSSGPISPLKVYCDMETDGGGYTFKPLYIASPPDEITADLAEIECQRIGMHLFVPRTRDHLKSAWDYIMSSDDPSVSYFTILAIYPTSRGATCPGTQFNSDSCTSWVAWDRNGYWIGERTDIPEPNGDNNLGQSMRYQWNSDGTIAYYNDCAVTSGCNSDNVVCCLNGPMHSNKFICDVGDKYPS